MSATQDLIAAALAAVDELHDINQVVPIHDRIENQLREACARAMVQPDVSEVERLVQNLESCAKWAAVEVEDENHRRIWLEEQKVTRTELLDAVRAIVAERDALRKKSVISWNSFNAYGDVASTREVLRLVEFEASRKAYDQAAPQPVGEVPMLDADATAYALHNYGDAREAAGYAAGVAAGGKDAERYLWLRENGHEAIGADRGCGPEWIYGVELDALIDAALRGEVKP